MAQQMVSWFVSNGRLYSSAESRLVWGAKWVEDRPYGCPYVQTCI